MAASKGTSRHAIRIEDALWDEFGAAAAHFGWDRSTLLRNFMTWYAFDLERVTYRRAYGPFPPVRDEQYRTASDS